MKTLFVGLVGATILFVSQAADAQIRRDNWPNWYVGLHGEIDFVSDADASVNGAGVGDVEFDSGFGLGANIGYRPYFSNSFLDNMRFELEYFYRNADFDNLSGGTALDGDLTGQSLMVNAYYDVDTGASVTPYVGAGLGYTSWDFDSQALATSDDDTVFSYQFMGGFYFSPRVMPQTDWGVGYRYFGTADPEFTTNAGNGLEHDYSSHNLEFFGRFRF